VKGALSCIVLKILVSYRICHPNDRVVTTNASFSKVLLEHSLLIFYYDSSLLLAESFYGTCQIANPSMDQFLIPSSREPYITNWWFSV